MLIRLNSFEVHFTLWTGYNCLRADLIMRLLVFSLHRLLTFVAGDHRFGAVLVMFRLMLAKEGR